MTFDNIDELYKIARVHPGAKLLVRILADDSKSICRFGIKFGASLDAVPGLLSKAKELNLDVIGVSFHVGSGCYDPSAYADAIRRARAAFDIGKDVGYEFSMLDVGGGFEDALFERAAAVLTEAIDQHFPDRCNLQMISEPGRFYVSNAFCLAANVIARRVKMGDIVSEAVPDDTDQPSVMCMFLLCSRPHTLCLIFYLADYINDGVYGAFNCILFDHQTVHPYVLSLNGSFHVSASEPLRNSSLWGPTCDSLDCISKCVALPSALQTGDWLGFDNMGAYTICAASQFNGFEISNVIYTTGDVRGAEVRSALAAFAAKGYGL
jgi:ornithine decarboxylase